MSSNYALNNNNNQENLSQNSPTAKEIQAWLISYLAEILKIDPDEVDATIPFERYGLDSEAAIVLTGDLQEWLKCNLDPTLLFDYPTVQALAEHLTHNH